MKKTCTTCGREINLNDKFCTNCGTKLSENQGSESMKEIIVSTGDIQRDYDVLRPIHLFHHSLNNKDRFGEKNLSVDEVIDHIIDEMKEEASEEGCDAIINLRVDFEQLQLSGTQYFVYGTLVKFN